VASKTPLETPAAHIYFNPCEPIAACGAHLCFQDLVNGEPTGPMLSGGNVVGPVTTDELGLALSYFNGTMCVAAEASITTSGAGEPGDDVADDDAAAADPSQLRDADDATESFPEPPRASDEATVASNVHFLCRRGAGRGFPSLARGTGSPCTVALIWASDHACPASSHHRCSGGCGLAGVGFVLFYCGKLFTLTRITNRIIVFAALPAAGSL
jgi:hypothetical protein